MPRAFDPDAPVDPASTTLAEQAQAAPLANLRRKTPIGVAPQTPLADALAKMHEERIGSLLVFDGAGAAVGILTRHDVIGRVVLPQLPLSTPVERAMSAPVHTLTLQHTLHDAALLMSREGIRHVPLTDDAGRVVNLVSERDVFALQRLSLRPVSAAIRSAADVPAMAEAARQIRAFARELLAHGVAARQVTQLISHLNDLLTERLTQLLALECGVDLRQACWLAFGSEGRSEQTIATDQDNGLVFESANPERDRAGWLAYGRRVNEALDRCGYPLCKGRVMAGEPECCLTADEWVERFRRWMEHGAPADLLNACIYFDARPLAGRLELARPMRELVAREAARLPRFLKQMAENALHNPAPLSWYGGIEADRVDGRTMFDLKFHGAMIFVDAARLFALAAGAALTGTRERLRAAGAALNAPVAESEAWIGAFEFVQMLRLRTQLEHVPVDPANPNLIDIARLNDFDQRMLKEALRVARRLQQRIELDYRR
jgi:CBS domain-containing protein